MTGKKKKIVKRRGGRKRVELGGWRWRNRCCRGLLDRGRLLLAGGGGGTLFELFYGFVFEKNGWNLIDGSSVLWKLGS